MFYNAGHQDISREDYGRMYEDPKCQWFEATKDYHNIHRQVAISETKTTVTIISESGDLYEWKKTPDHQEGIFRTLKEAAIWKLGLIKHDIESANTKPESVSLMEYFNQYSKEHGIDEVIEIPVMIDIKVVKERFSTSIRIDSHVMNNTIANGVNYFAAQNRKEESEKLLEWITELEAINGK